MSQQILLLKLLYVPVYVIKFIVKTISIVTYLPNYFVILILDSIIFGPQLQKTFAMYSLTWLLRFLALHLVTLVFILQFYAVYLLLDLTEQAYWAQILAMALALGGILFLMRKGYLQMIKKFQPTKLKSPIQHIQEHYVFVKDIIGILLALTNIILLKNSLLTFSYLYNPYKSSFLAYITKLIHSSLIYDLTFFYIKVFFKLLPWRYQYHLKEVEKQTQQANILYLLVLLTILFAQTILDVLVLIIFGGFCVGHYKRNVFYLRLKQNQAKYKVALIFFSQILVQLFLIILTLPCMILNFTQTMKNLKMIINDQNQTKFGPSKYFNLTVRLILLSLLKVPAYLSLALIYIFRYKYHKLKFIISQQSLKEDKQKQQKDTSNEIFLEDLLYIKLLGQQIFDSGFVPLILICTIIRLQNFKWLLIIIDRNYDLQRKLIFTYFTKCIFDPFWAFYGILLSLATCSYAPRYIIGLIKAYYMLRTNMSISQSIREQSIYKKYAIGISVKLKQDCPYLPLFFFMKVNMFGLFVSQLSPKNSFQNFIKISKMYYFHRVKRRKAFQKYLDMFNCDIASGLITNEGHKMRFWKYAFYCQRIIQICNVLSFLMPKRKYLSKVALIQRPQAYSALSNQFWYQYQVLRVMFRQFIFFLIAIIISILGFIILVPLTLWRLPTFVIIYRIQNTRRLFFTIIVKIYKIMLQDLFLIFINLFAFLLTPIGFIKFKINTAFRYDLKGHETLLANQKKKTNFIRSVLIKRTLKIYAQTIKVIFIFCIHIRRKAYLMDLKRNGINFAILKQNLIKGSNIPTFLQLIQKSYKFSTVNFGQFDITTTRYFIMSLKDIPYMLISVVVLILTPWRYFYLSKAIKLMIDDPHLRYQIIKVLRNVFKDYLCIFMNILLLLSIVKTKKALQLIIRNYKLNFFVGFLKYSFRKQLFYQLKQALGIYYSILLILICFTMDPFNILVILKKLTDHYLKNLQQKRSKQQNNKLYSNTVKQKKDLQILDKMGFNEYLTMCQFLTPKQLITLSKASKINYLMIQREQIWIQKWENLYSQKYQNNIQGETYRIRCIKAYLENQHLVPKKLTYNELVRKMFVQHVYQSKIDLPMMIKPKLAIVLQQKLYKNYQWSLTQGYGPTNQLPQQQNQDAQFLRITGQIRRPLIQITNQSSFYWNLLFICPIERVSQKLNRFYSIDQKRRFKQFTFLGLALGVVYMIYLFFAQIFWHILAPDRFVGLRLLTVAYFVVVFSFLLRRIQLMYHRQWISLKPFDIFWDFINFIKKTLRFVKNKSIQLKNWIYKKIYSPAKFQLSKFLRFLVIKMRKVSNFISSKSSAFYKGFKQKVALPTYIYISKKLIVLKTLILLLFSNIKSFIKLIIKSFIKVLSSGWKILKLMFQNLNQLYFNILLLSRKFLNKFGLVGELIFTIQGLTSMMMPTIVCLLFYYQRWFIIVSTVHSAMLVILTYKHLTKIKNIIN